MINNPGLYFMFQGPFRADLVIRDSKRIQEKESPSNSILNSKRISSPEIPDHQISP
jgi:hypothetical protein